MTRKDRSSIQTDIDAALDNMPRAKTGPGNVPAWMLISPRRRLGIYIAAAIVLALAAIGIPKYIKYSDTKHERRLAVKAERQAKAAARAARGAFIERTDKLSPTKSLTRIRIPDDLLPGDDFMDRKCFIYHNIEIHTAAMTCDPE